MILFVRQHSTNDENFSSCNIPTTHGPKVRGRDVRRIYAETHTTGDPSRARRFTRDFPPLPSSHGSTAHRVFVWGQRVCKMYKCVCIPFVYYCTRRATANRVSEKDAHNSIRIRPWRTYMRNNIYIRLIVLHTCEEAIRSFPPVIR